MPSFSRETGRRPTVLFDLDGTLIDTIELILNSARYAFEKLDREAPSDSEWAAGIGIPLFTMFGRYARDAADQAALIAAYREYQLANHDRLTRCYTDVVDTVAMLAERGHELAIVTSKSEALALRGLTHVGLARFMDTIVGCDGSTRHKPDPEPVQIALHRLACAPEDAIFVGDSVHDILAGNAAGVTTVAATWGAFRRSDLEPGQPDFYMESISELIGLVERHRSNLSPRGTI
jgi:pyrophosphatase PpaX